MRRSILLPALALLALAACEEDDPVTPRLRVQCDPLLVQVSGVTGDTVAAEGGLRYLERQAGSGDPVAAGDSVDVHYTLSFLDGTVEQSSCVSGFTFPFTLGRQRAIEGFDRGVTGMRPGGVRRVIVPPALGYGDSPDHELRNDTLVFDIELVHVTR